MHKMGIEAIYPKPRTSMPHPEHRIYPYLLRGVEVNRTQQVWSTDIFTSRLGQAGIRISMDGRGRAMDNIFIERLWRTVKDEDVY